MEPSRSPRAPALAAVRPGRLARRARHTAIALAALLAALTAASLGYNLSTDGAPGRPPGLRMLKAGGFDTRYRTWGTAGPPIVLVPGAFETADTFAALGAALGAGHRVYAIDLTGTGYSVPSPPFDARHLAAQLGAFLTAEKLTGQHAAVLVGHSSGAAVAGLTALAARPGVAGVVFLDGDATPLPVPSFAGPLLINPFRATVLRLALNSSWLIRRIYASQCGPACGPLTAAGLRRWRLPLEQPGFESEVGYALRHGIPSMTAAQFRRLAAARLPTEVIYGSGDPQLSAAAAARAAARIGAPPPVAVPGRHLTMISSPHQVAAAIDAFIRASKA